MLSHARELCEDTIFIDIDYPQLMDKKCETIRQKANLSDLLDEVRESSDPNLVKLRSEQYVAVGCDLADIATVKRVVREECDSRSAFLSSSKSQQRTWSQLWLTD